jgi:hypothetical protein
VAEEEEEEEEEEVEYRIVSATPEREKDSQ